MLNYSLFNQKSYHLSRITLGKYHGKNKNLMMVNVLFFLKLIHSDLLSTHYFYRSN